LTLLVGWQERRLSCEEESVSVVLFQYGLKIKGSLVNGRRSCALGSQLIVQ